LDTYDRDHTRARVKYGLQPRAVDTASTRAMLAPYEVLEEADGAVRIWPMGRRTLRDLRASAMRNETGEEISEDVVRSGGVGLAGRYPCLAVRA